MNEQQILIQGSELLYQVETLQLHTLGIDTTSISDLIDEINQRLNPELVQNW